MIHLRCDDSRPKDAPDCVCGDPACTRWYEDLPTLALAGDEAAEETLPAGDDR